MNRQKKWALVAVAGYVLLLKGVLEAVKKEPYVPRILTEEEREAHDLAVREYRLKAAHAFAEDLRETGLVIVDQKGN